MYMYSQSKWIILLTNYFLSYIDKFSSYNSNKKMSCSLFVHPEERVTIESLSHEESLKYNNFFKDNKNDYDNIIIDSLKSYNIDDLKKIKRILELCNLLDYEYTVDIDENVQNETDNIPNVEFNINIKKNRKFGIIFFISLLKDLNINIDYVNYIKYKYSNV